MLVQKVMNMVAWRGHEQPLLVGAWPARAYQISQAIAWQRGLREPIDEAMEVAWPEGVWKNLEG